VSFSRRGLFSLLARPIKATVEGKSSDETPVPSPLRPENRFAVVLGRHCYAESHGCNVCVERCPVPDAITLEDGLPMVSPNLCNGCGICYDECPAPTRAIMWMARRKPETP
jgi:Na+-translocating ferredoxin:NAD+ oxidoreductase RNF subunit RnfB